MGVAPADTVIRGGRVVNVFTGEVLKADVAVARGRVAFVGDAAHTLGPDTAVIDASGLYLVPGFIDGHVHVESSMLSLTQFCQAVLPRGTTAIFMDPHEIANVLGLDGVRLLLAEGEGLPLKVFATVPSCVPAAPRFEDAGASLDPAAVARALAWPRVAGLGEVMDFPAVIEGDERIHAEIGAALGLGKPATGHYAHPDLARGLVAYAASGVSSDHESTDADDVVARLRLGMWTMLREGSAWRDVRETVKAITEAGLNARRAVLVTDDCHPHTLLTEGHMDRVVRTAISAGLRPVTAIQMATLNPAEYFGVDAEMGGIAPGRRADIVFLTDLATVEVHQVMVDGQAVAREGRMLKALPDPRYPEFVRHSVKLARPLAPRDFAVHAPAGAGGGEVTVRVIEVVEAKALTRHRTVTLPNDGGVLRAQPERDIAKVAVVERHGGGGGMGLGFVRGFGLQRGAVASTVAHDSHNLLIVGVDDGDMAAAGNALAECGGGMVAISGGRVMARVELPVAGLMSPRPACEVAAAVAELERAWRSLGCHLVSPFMTMSLLALPVLPELRVTNRGLVDTVRFRVVDVVA
ncbi:MAG: adenine deaminase [Bacillota bacterium]